MDGEPVERKRQQSIGTSFMVDKGNHRHFMEKEIHEQPEVISHTLAHYLDFANGTSKPLDLPFDFAKIDRLAISACGTAYLAGLIGKYWFERYARLPVDIDVASEFRYREMPLSKTSAALFISQSGETADTLASLRYCRKAGHADRRHRQCARIDHRARIRRDLADAGRPGDRRRLDQGLHLPACRCWRRLRVRAGGGARHDLARCRRRRWCASFPRRRAMPARC